MNTKNIVLSLMAAALLAAAPAAAFADSCAKPVHSACPALEAPCERPGHPAPQLSVEQAAELQKLRAEHHAALTSLRDSIAQKKLELHALAPNPNVKPDELKALTAEISDLRKQMRALGKDYRAKLEKASRRPSGLRKTIN
ncbi:periplasmic heavy metal sensor [Mailhella sp.]|uniref:periplasmic heavy metal sensor n=1 Tax=Mailhella sp. TaxID=1981029 RepID=UPI00406453B6